MTTTSNSFDRILIIEVFEAGKPVEHLEFRMISRSLVAGYTSQIEEVMRRYHPSIFNYRIWINEHE